MTGISRLRFQRAASLALAVLMLLMIANGLLQGRAFAAGQLTSRSLTISTSNPSATGVTHTFNFAIATTGNIGSMEFLYCTTALGTCTAPTGLSVSSATISSQTINAVATSFTIGTNTANKIQITRTAASATSGWAAVFAFGGITNPSTSTQTPVGNNTFFVRITTYATASYTTTQDTGTVASAIIAQFQVSATIQEVLYFCVGTTTVDDATTSVGADCSNISGTSINIGTLDPSLICRGAPAGGGGTQNPCQNGDGNGAVAMVRTNASNGVVVTYKAIQGSGSNHLGTLRVSGATCSASNVSTDQCINAIGTTQTAITAGTEAFGFTVAGTNCGSTTSYTCVLTSGSNNLKAATNYIGATATSYGVSAGYAWDETGTSGTIATSAGSSVKVVDDEALMIKYAATAATTSPTGSYSVNTDYIAVPTY